MKQFVVGVFLCLFGATNGMDHPPETIENYRSVDSLLEAIDCCDMDHPPETIENYRSVDSLLEAIDCCDVDAVKRVLKRNEITVIFESYREAIWHSILNKLQKVLPTISCNEAPKCVEIAKLILEKDKNLDFGTFRKPISHIVPLIVNFNNTEILQQLFRKNGIDVNAVTECFPGEPAITVAARKGYFEVVKVLLQHPDIEIDRPTSFGQTALYAALVELGNNFSKAGSIKPIVKLLLENGASPFLLQSNEKAIYLAIENGDIELIELLLSYGAEINAQTPDEIPPIFAVTEGRCEDNVNKLKFLIKQGADLNATHPDGQTFFEEVAELKDPELIQFVESLPNNR